MARPIGDARFAGAGKGWLAVLASVFVLGLAVLAFLWVGDGASRAVEFEARPEPAPRASSPPETLVRADALRPSLAPPEAVDEAEEQAHDAEERAQVNVGAGMLRVRLVSDTTADALPGVSLFLEPAQEHESRGSPFLGPARTRPGEAAVTDVAGEARFRVPAAVPLVLSVRASQAGGEDLFVSEPGLEPGEQCERVLALAAPRLTWFHGLVLDAQTEAALAGANVVVLERRYSASLGCWSLEQDTAKFGRTETDFGGRFRLPHASTLLGAELEVRVPGYAPATLQAPRGHDSPDTPAIVRLHPSAALLARLMDESGAARVDFTVRLESEPTAAPARFEAQSDANGTYVFENLPARTVLLPRVVREDVTRIFAPLQLEPGQALDVTWLVDDGCTVFGTLVDETGLPVSLARVKLVSLDNPELPVFQQSCESTFRFADVGAGAWRLVASSQVRRGPDGRTFLSRDRVLAIEELTIALGEREKEIALALLPAKR